MTESARGLGRLMALAVWTAACGAGAQTAPMQTPPRVAITPEGDVGIVHQVVARFSEPMEHERRVDLAADPVELHCSTDPLVVSNGHWSDARTFTIDIEGALSPRSTCVVTVRSGLRSMAGIALAAVPPATLRVGGPGIQGILPAPGAHVAIAERQAFALLMNGPVALAEIVARTHCEVSAGGASERLPVVAVPDAERAILAKALGFAEHPDRVGVVACERPLPANAHVGIAFASEAAIASQRFDYTVRAGLSVRFEADCGTNWERLGRRGGMRCDAGARRIDSYGNVKVDFSRPVPLAQARRVRLMTVAGAREPTVQNLRVIDARVAQPMVNGITFGGPFPAGDRLVALVPADLVDREGGRRVDGAMALAAIDVVAGLGNDVEAVSLSTGAFAVRGPSGADVVVDPHASLQLRGTRVLRVPSEASTADGFDDAALMRWIDLAQRYRSGGFERRATVAVDLDAAIAARAPGISGAPNEAAAENTVATSAVSLLADPPAAVRPLAPQPGAAADRRLATLHLAEPGLHLVEVAYDAPANDEVVGVAHQRGVVLVTDLAVHLFRGSNGVLAWVTSRSNGRAVPGAAVQMSDCSGRRVAGGRTDDRGALWMPNPASPAPDKACQDALRAHARADRFVTARLAAGDGRQDLAFLWESWGGGYLSLVGNDPPSVDGAVQSFAGRKLLAPGQTVAMKHWLRQRTLDGWELPPRAVWPTQVIVVDPAGDETTLPLAWSERGDAHWQWRVPASARRGTWQVALAQGGQRVPVTRFDVRDFRIPEIDASQAALDAPWHAGAPATLEVSARYFNGGPAVGTRVELDSRLETSWPEDDEALYAPAPDKHYDYAWDRGPGRHPDEERWEAVGDNFRYVLDSGAFDERGRLLHANPHQSALIDATGHARFSVPTGSDARLSLIEASLRFADPDGEVRRLRTQLPIWPSTRRIGIKLAFDRESNETGIDVAVLDLRGRPIGGAVVRLDVVTPDIRNDMLSLDDGFDVVHVRTTWHAIALPADCKLVTNVSGLAHCTIKMMPGGLRVAAGVADESGALAWTYSRNAGNQTTPPYGRTGFASPPSSPVDPLPGKPPLLPLEVRVAAGVHRVGETVTGSVAGQFDHQSAMLLVETEGVLDWRSVVLDGDDPAFAWKIDRRWMPGATVAAVALSPDPADRGQGRVGARPAPTLRTGQAKVEVDTSNLRLAVGVKVDAAQVRPGETTRVRVRVTRADGSAAPAGTHVALAVVDAALFTLLPNDVHELEQAFARQRWAGVTIASLQSRPDAPANRSLTAPAFAAGAPAFEGVQRVEITGSSIKRPETAAKLRSAFDTALAWLPEVALDANGEATIPVATNDSLAHWRVIAVADGATAADALLAGSGEAAFDTRQPLQLTAGLPPVVHARDTYRATLSVRNDTDRAIDVRVTARAGRADLGIRTTHLAAQARVDVGWEVHAPAAAGELAWEFGAAGPAMADRIEFRQQVVATVPVTVRQATLVQVSGALDVPLLPLAGTGATLTLHAAPSLGADLPGVAAFFRDYRYRCLEQRVSLAVGQRDASAWQGIVDDLASYLDDDDLPSWFPPPGDAQVLLQVGRGNAGSDVLAAYLVAVSAQARSQGLPFALPEPARARLVAALTNVAYGVLQRDESVPAGGAATQATLRRIAAIAALARVEAAQPSMMDGITIDLEGPTATLLDLREIVVGLRAFPDRDAMLVRVDARLRARLDERASRVSLVARPDDEMPGLMRHPDVDAVRLALLAVRDPAWRDLAPRLVAGALARQQRGHWATTVANAWGTLMMADFAQRFESQPVTGVLSARIGGGVPATVVDWQAAPSGATARMALASAAAPSLRLEQRGTGAPWVSVLASAAVPVTRPDHHGFAIRKTITPLAPHPGGALERGDLVRVHLDVEASADATWVAVDDPLPAGASVVGGGLYGLDPELAIRRDFRREPSRLAYVDPRFDRYQAFFSHVSAGHFSLDYTIRLDTVGRFGMPATRVEAMYAPEMFGEWPNATIAVGRH